MKARTVTLMVCALTLCSGTGVALAQTCLKSVPDPMSNSRYEMNADGTVVDLHTGLMWMRCALGQSWDSKKASPTCTGTANTYDWQGALKAVQTLNQNNGYAGYNDWRLPNERELASLARFACTDPAINETAFPATPSNVFWTSTPVSASFGVEWGVDFKTGQAYYHAYNSAYPIRLVRAGAFAYKP